MSVCRDKLSACQLSTATDSRHLTGSQDNTLSENSDLARQFTWWCASDYVSVTICLIQWLQFKTIITPGPNKNASTFQTTFTILMTTIQTQSIM